MPLKYYYGEPPTSNSTSGFSDTDDKSFDQPNATSSVATSPTARRTHTPARIGVLSGLLLSAVMGPTSDVGLFAVTPTAPRTQRTETPFGPPSTPRAKTAQTKAVEPSEEAKVLTESSFRDSIRRIHQASGLTLDEIGQLIGVSRRTVHNWLQGARISSNNVKNLSLVASLLEKEDKGDPAKTRAYLLTPRLGGISRYERILAHRLDGNVKKAESLNPSQRLSTAESPRDVHGTLLHIEDFG